MSTYVNILYIRKQISARPRALEPSSTKRCLHIALLQCSLLGTRVRETKTRTAKAKICVAIRHLVKSYSDDADEVTSVNQTSKSGGQFRQTASVAPRNRGPSDDIIAAWRAGACRRHVSDNRGLGHGPTCP